MIFLLVIILFIAGCFLLSDIEDIEAEIFREEYRRRGEEE